MFASARAKNLFAKILVEARDRHGFALVRYVVMPEHIHLLIGEPAQGTPLDRPTGLETARVEATPWFASIR